VSRVVDSSVWIEYLGEGPLAAETATYLEPPEEVITPVVVLYEVYRWARREGGDAPAMEAVGQIERTRIMPADPACAIVAAEVGAERGLAAADAFVYGAARLEGCGLVTLDGDFRDLPGVTLIEA
jgi:predicted nucleic acid-binding protein